MSARTAFSIIAAAAIALLSVVAGPVLSAWEFDCVDFVTGGGFIEPRYEGGPVDRVNFGFNAGARSPSNQELKGHFNLVDHNDGTHVSGYDVLFYDVCYGTDERCRRFGGNAKVDGVDGYTYDVTVCDYGEPGRDDRIRVMVFLGADMVYFADDFDSTKQCDPHEDNCGDLDGGNIQLHKYCEDCPEH